MKTKRLTTSTKPVRLFTESFKRARVVDYEKGLYTVGEIADLYHTSRQTIYNWIDRYSILPKPGIRVIGMADSPDRKLDELKAKLAEYERLIGQQTAQILFLEKIVELAGEKSGEDLKKNFGTNLSTPSGKILKTGGSL